LRDVSSVALFTLLRAECIDEAAGMTLFFTNGLAFLAAAASSMHSARSSVNKATEETSLKENHESVQIEEDATTTDTQLRSLSTTSVLLEQEALKRQDEVAEQKVQNQTQSFVFDGGCFLCH
jgi:hypothetical protein